MKALRLIPFLCLFAALGGLKAQPKFITHGKIEFEKRTNQHSLLDEESVWDELMKKEYPKFASTYYDLYFNEQGSLYKPGREPENNKIHWALNYLSNIVYKDLEHGSTLTQKNLFGSDYLIRDSLQKVDWKLSSEPRTIAGFECRKAVGKVFDSVIVIAYYTDEIVPSTGPESFNGLPGMILGLAIPRMHTTWYATKLELVDVGAKELTPPKEGKKITGAEFKGQMSEFLKNNDWLKKLSWQMLI
jgi:GLPGLI family protein